MSDTHALYRFFSADAELLYVGITCDPGQRWKKHAEDKPWWAEVTRITMEAHPDRQAVLNAEVEAIRTEHPKYNQQHNGNNGNGNGGPPVRGKQDTTASFVKVGDCIALGLADNDCPVGLVTAVDDEWIRLDLLDWLIGTFSGRTFIYRRTEVLRILVADLMPAERDGHERGLKVFDCDPLGTFQVRWEHRNDPAEVREAALRQYYASLPPKRR